MKIKYSWNNNFLKINKNLFHILALLISFNNPENKQNKTKTNNEQYVLLSHKDSDKQHNVSLVES
jgi:hypothetical protein